MSNIYGKTRKRQKRMQAYAHYAMLESESLEIRFEVDALAMVICEHVGSAKHYDEVAGELAETALDLVRRCKCEHE